MYYRFLNIFFSSNNWYFLYLGNSYFREYFSICFKFTLIKVDGGRDENIVKQYNVTALPVFIVFKDGKQVWRKDGIAEEKEIAAQFK